MRCAAAVVLLSITFTAGAQRGDWYNLSPSEDGIPGASVNKALTLIKGDVILRPVLVAVIDDGVDIKHPDFEGRIWINPGEVANDGIDNDKNGFIDDIHGWNFLGNAQGEVIKQENLEVTRQLRNLKTRFDDVDPSSLRGADKKAYREYQNLQQRYDELTSDLEDEFAQFSQITALYSGALAFAKERTGSTDLTMQQIMEHQTQDDDERQVFEFLVMAELQGVRRMIEEGSTYFDSALNYHYNLEYDPRHLVNTQIGKGYGNNLVDAANPDHGTHVAGIIAAIRGNGMGVDGIAPNAIIIPVRAVPDGDERDEDIAAAIRYAVDAGAKVINMSFGKELSPDKALVKAAALYALEKDVLLVHAAGNDFSNNDKEPNYPDGTMGKRKSLNNWITVGAINQNPEEGLLAEFSNYGKRKVDILAPGVDILSLEPGGGVVEQSGTSMAAPVVAGVAALIRGVNPALSAKEVKDILIKSAQSHADAPVYFEDGKSLPLKKVVRNPAVVDAHAALKMALGQ